jgi:hypothetical protein
MPYVFCFVFSQRLTGADENTALDHAGKVTQSANKKRAQACKHGVQYQVLELG